MGSFKDSIDKMRQAVAEAQKALEEERVRLESLKEDQRWREKSQDQKPS